MRKLSYRIVDVFTDRIFRGNPLAVFLDGRAVSDTEMQALAREMNLSETTFVLPPDDPANDFGVRIFTPGRELPMAGHPTVGTAFVLAREKMLPAGGDTLTIRLEEKVGLIPVRLEMKNGAPDNIWMTQPCPTFGPVFPHAAAVAEILGIEPAGIRSDLPVEVVSCGVPFLFVPVRDLGTMRRLNFNKELCYRALDSLGVHEVFVFAMEVEDAGSTVHSRMFAPELGIPEDPATDSASGPLGCYLVRHGVVPAKPKASIISEQGIEMGRPSFIHIEITQEADEITEVKAGGQTVFVGGGEIELGIGQEKREVGKKVESSGRSSGDVT
jgi:trans-2,3-dihydro-3-hydroxyanthranilate isomerase